jgi:hypothetical protein
MSQFDPSSNLLLVAKSFNRLIREMIHSLDLLFLFYQEKRKSHSGGELKE